MHSTAISKNEQRLRLRVFWGDILYDTRVFAGRSTLRVGSSDSNDFILDLGDTSSWLLGSYDGRDLRLHLRPNQEGFFQSAGETLPLRLIEKKKQVADSSFDLSVGETAELLLGECTFSFDWVEEEKIARTAAISPASLLPSTIVGSLLAGVFFLTSAFPPAKQDPVAERSVKLVREVKAPPVKPPEPPPPPPEPVIEVQPEPVKPVAMPEPVAPKASRVAKPKPTIAKKQAPAIPDPFATQEKADEWQDLGGTIQQLQTTPKGKARTAKSAAAPTDLAGTSDMTSLRGLANEEKLDSTSGQGSGELVRGKQEELAPTKKSPEGNGLERETIERFVRDRQPRLTGCFERGGIASARITLRFVIRADGMTSSIKVVDDNAGEKSVTQCVVSEVAGWRFPRSPHGTPSHVEYPFSFQRR